MDAIDQTDFATAFLSDSENRSETASNATPSDHDPSEYSNNDIADNDELSNTINPLRIVNYSDSPPDNSEWERQLWRHQIYLQQEIIDTLAEHNYCKNSPRPNSPQYKYTKNLTRTTSIINTVLKELRQMTAPPK